MTRSSALHLFVAFLALPLLSPVASGQRVGIVWERPQDAIRASADLRAIADLGFTAVRTGPWRERRLSTLADTLGLIVFSDIGPRFATATDLQFHRPSVEREILAAALSRGVRFVGLAIAPNSADPNVCRMLAEMDAAAEPLDTYIVSVYAPSDPCAGAVDLILYRRGDAGAASGLPLADLGWPLRLNGVAQADYLADVLPYRAALDTWTFVYRWGDADSTTAFAAMPMNRQWGLRAADGSSRPSLNVVYGVLREGRRAFDRPASTIPRRPVNQNVVVGWLMIVAILVAFARNPRFRPMTVRYFTAHGIWRSAVQENRDPMSLANATLLVTMALLTGMVGQLAMRLAQDHPAYEAIWNWATPGVRGTLDALLNSPPTLTLVLGGSALILSLVWMAAWYGVVGRRHNARFSQILMLSVWPRWPILLTLPPMMLAASAPTVTMAAAVWIMVSGLWSAARTNIDAMVVFRLPPLSTAMLWLLTPEFLAFLTMAALVALNPEEAAFIQKLIG